MFNSDIENVALSLINQSLQIMPMRGDKKANWAFIPFDDNDRKSLNLFFAQNEFPTPNDVTAWLGHHDTKGIALATGIVTVIDIDVPVFFSRWLACEGVREVLERRRVPLMRSGGGGYQLPVIVGVPNDQKPKTSKVAWVVNEEKAEGREIAIEVKGFSSVGNNGYVMTPMSLHPSGNLYREIDGFGGSYDNIPMITSDEWQLLISAAKSLCEAPKSKSQLKREEDHRQKLARQAAQPRKTYSNKKESPIDRFNQDNSIEDMLRHYGYTHVYGDRWAFKANHGGRSDVAVVGDCAFFYNDNDPQTSYKSRSSAFDIYFLNEYGGLSSRIGEAVKDLAEEYRIDYATKYKEKRAVSVPAAPVPVPAAPVPVPAAPVQEPFFDLCPPPPPPPPPDYYDDIPPSSLDYYDHMPYEDMSYDDMMLDCGVIGHEPVALSEPIFEPKIEPLVPSAVYETFEYENYVTGLRAYSIEMMRKHGKRFCINRAPTGAGKSTDSVKPNSHITAPTQAIVKQIAKNGAFPILEGVHTGEIPESLDLGTVSTYNSILRATKSMSGRGLIYEESSLAVDEIHHLLTDGGFRLKSLCDLVEATDYYDYNILMSATPFADILSRTLFQDCVIIDVVCKDLNRSALPPVQFFYADSDHDVSTMIQLSKSQPNQIGILHANHKDYLEEVAKKLGDGAYTFTSDTKKEPYHVKMVEEGNVPDDCKWILTTNLYNDGISLLPNEHFIVISRKSDLLAEEVQQIIARQRVGKNMIKPSCVVIMKKEGKDKAVDLTSGRPMDIVTMYHDHIEDLKVSVDMLNRQRFEMLARLETSNSEIEKGLLRRRLDSLSGETFIISGKTYEDEYKINKVAVLNSAIQKKRMRLTTGQLIHEMSLTGEFKFAGELVVNELTVDKEVKDALIEAKAEKNEEARSEVEMMLDKAAGIEGLKVFENVSENPDDYSKKIKDAVFSTLRLWREFERSGGKLNRMIDMIKDKKAFTTGKLNKLRFQFIVSDAFRLIELDDDNFEKDAIDAKALMKIRELIKDGDKLSKGDVERLRLTIGKIEGARLVGKWDSIEKATRSIKRLFEAKPSSKSGPDGKINVTKIIGAHNFDQWLIK